MSLIQQTESHVFICAGDLILKLHTVDDKHETIKLPDIIMPPNLTKGQQEVIQNENRIITTACFSSKKDYYAVAAQNKQLVVYDSDFKVVKNCILSRAASKIRFTPQDDVLVADKTGDAYLYKLDDEKNEPTLILGHLSMLLDILISDCGKYIITCDRDEKIRVSYFPNAYNIISYCLGHKEFVTNVELIDQVLISASGDGTIRFWNFLSGTQLECVNTNDFIKDREMVEVFCKEMDEEKCDVVALPITDMQVYRGANMKIAVSLHYTKDIQIYALEEVNALKVKWAFLQCVSYENVSIVSFSLGEILYVLSDSQIVSYNFTDSKYGVKCSDYTTLIGAKFALDRSSISNISVLYKRKFDNVQDYLERKRLRIEAK